MPKLLATEAGMAGNRVLNAAELLERHYGRRVAFPPGDWSSLVGVVLEHGGTKSPAHDWSWLDETSLRGPNETAQQTGSRLEEIAAAAGLKSRQTKLLPGLARWWLQNFGDISAGADFRSHSLETWQRGLRAVRGVSWELADRILLVVGGLDVYPLDRGSQRIAARHGWMDLSAEYDEWQAFFVGGLRASGAAIADLSRWNLRVGREFCGVQPKCEKCPLQPLLPPRGPAPLSEE
jgi:endonuclease-3 related protein